MNMNEQKLHPIAEQLLTWFSDAITLEEIQARINIVNGVVENFVSNVNQQIEANKTAQAVDEQGNEVQVEEIK